MKLVTGIEAIQSGKSWEHKNDDGWSDAESTLGCLTPAHLFQEVFIIKEEPREFWLDTTRPNCNSFYPVDYPGADFSGDNWIKVREVDK